MQSILAGVLRHAITMGGGAGALEGVTTGDPVVTTVSVVAIVAGLAWSVVQKLVSK